MSNVLTTWLTNENVAFAAHSVLMPKGGALRPLAAAAWVPIDVVPATMAPAIPPAMAPRGPTHQQAMPRVNTPQVALAAIADNAVATPVMGYIFIPYKKYIRRTPKITRNKKWYISFSEIKNKVG